MSNIVFISYSTYILKQSSISLITRTATSVLEWDDHLWTRRAMYVHMSAQVT